MAPTKSILIPGFCFAGVAAGLKDSIRKKDVALIYATQPGTQIAGVFTTNRMAAAPVRICRDHIKKGVGRVIVVNSGNANAATGADGERAARKTVAETALAFGVAEATVFPCSTGKIGVKLPVDKVIAGMKLAKARLHNEGFHRAHQAILTTDAYPKLAVRRGLLGKKPYTLAAMAKGAGMICPDMATMLCYILTDLTIPALVLQALLKDALAQTLNALSVDGDTSTNDTTLMLASGATGHGPLKPGTRAYNEIQKQLTGLLEDIAIQIALDGEGATKCFLTTVSGAKTQAEARVAARAIANSPLVKTAMFGNDPNWGRILCAVGYSGAQADEASVEIRIGGKPLFAKGRPQDKNLGWVAKYLKANKRVRVDVCLGRGTGRARMIASDLTYGYVRLNAEYHT